MTERPVDDHATPEVLPPAPGPTPLARRSPRDVLRELVMVLPNLAVLVTRLLRDRRVPLRRKIVAAGVVAYLVSPVDVIPELVPGFGLLDDVILAAAAVALVGSALDREELLELWPGSEDALDLVLAVAEWALDLVPDPFRGWLEG